MVGQPCVTQRYNKRTANDEAFQTEWIIDLASRYGRYSYRRVTALLRNEGWIVNHKRLERIWRQEGLKVPQKQPNKGRLWLNDGSIVRLKPLFPRHSLCWRVGFEDLFCPAPAMLNTLGAVPMTFGTAPLTKNLVGFVMFSLII